MQVKNLQIGKIYYLNDIDTNMIQTSPYEKKQTVIFY